MTTPTRIAYVPGLDGVRALALIGVLLFHAGHLQGGFLGVDLFFVLSGFLITSLLLVEWDASHRIDLRRFWSRRLRRLLPAALVVLLATAVYALIAMDAAEQYRFRGDALAALFDVANWRAIRAGSDYWASFATASPLQHMWSLSVEEQLYLLWPATILGCLWLAHRRRWGRQAVLVVTLALAGASMVAMAALVQAGHTERAYYGTDTRASAMLLGAAVAILLSRCARGTASTRADRAIARVLGGATPLVIAVLAVAWIRADGQALWLYRWGFPLFTASATVLVAAIATGAAGWLVGLLEVRPLRYLGRISYGAYLWHWPIFVVLDHPVAGSRYLQTAVRCGVTIVVAMASSRLIERPVRSASVPTRRWRPLALGGMATVVVAVVVATVGSAAPPTSVAEAAPTHPGTAVPTLLLVGDSEAYNLSLGAARVLGSRVSFAYHARIGCGIGPGYAVEERGVVVVRDISGGPCSEANAWLYYAVDRYRPNVVLVHEGAWDVLDRNIDGRDIPFGTPAWDAAVKANFAAVLTHFAKDGARVVAMAAPCYPPGGEGGGHTIRDDPRRVQRWNELLREVAPTVGASVLPYDSLYCGVPTDQQPRRPDGVHLTVPAAEQVWRWLEPRLGLRLSSS